MAASNILPYDIIWFEGTDKYTAEIRVIFKGKKGKKNMPGFSR